MRHSLRARRRFQVRESWRKRAARFRIRVTLNEFNADNLRLAFLGAKP